MWPVAKKTRRRSRGRRLRHSGQNRKVRQASDSTIVPSPLCVYPETKVLQSNPHALREHCIKKWRQISTGCILTLKLNSPDRSVFFCMFHFYLCKTEIAQCVAFHRDTGTMIPTCASCLHWLLKIICSFKLNHVPPREQVFPAQILKCKDPEPFCGEKAEDREWMQECKGVVSKTSSRRRSRSRSCPTG